MVGLKKTKRDIGNVLVLGTGLSIGTAVESRLAPPVAVFPKVVPVLAPVGALIGAGILLRSTRQLSMVGQQNKKRRRFI